MIIDSKMPDFRDHAADVSSPDLASRIPDFKHFICNRLLDHKRYIHKYGEDMPDIRNWKWKDRR